MDEHNIDPQYLEQLKKLEQKYESMGQDLSSYLDGLLYSKFLNYWDYINLDTLLNLQQPRTNYPDEEVFITYHQITELYFKLVINELVHIAKHKDELSEEFLLNKVNRLNRYFDQLISSYDIMVEGMEPEQFSKFRKALLPASGFQSVQFRLIEIGSTDMINLADQDYINKLEENNPVETLLEHIYWKKGATELSTGKKTLTLEHFEEKYEAKLIRWGKRFRHNNLRKILQKYKSEYGISDKLVDAFKNYDQKVNIDWKLIHLRSVSKYLNKGDQEIKATGGTNWKKYLPPKFQFKVFFPELWSEKELESWG